LLCNNCHIYLLFACALYGIRFFDFCVPTRQIFIKTEPTNVSGVLPDLFVSGMSLRISKKGESKKESNLCVFFIS